MAASRLTGNGFTAAALRRSLKKANQGSLRPTERKVPQAARVEEQFRREEVFFPPRRSRSWDLLMKPLKSGQPEIETAPDQIQGDREGHSGCDPAEVGEAAPPGGFDHRPGAHEQERLVEDVGIGVRHGAVQRQRNPEPHPPSP